MRHLKATSPVGGLTDSNTVTGLRKRCPVTPFPRCAGANPHRGLLWPRASGGWGALAASREPPRRVLEALGTTPLSVFMTEQPIDGMVLTSANRLFGPRGWASPSNGLPWTLPPPTRTLWATAMGCAQNLVALMLSCIQNVVPCYFLFPPSVTLFTLLARDKPVFLCSKNLIIFTSFG